MDRLKRFWQFAVSVVQAFNQDHCPFLAAALCYFAFFSLFPLLLGLIAMLGYLVTPAWAEHQVTVWLGHALPVQVSFVRDLVVGVAETRGSIGVAALVLLIWSGRGLFMSLAQALDLIWSSPPMTRWQQSVWRNVVATACALGLGAAALVVSGLYAALTLVLNLRIRSLGISPGQIPGLLWVLGDLLPVVLVAIGLLVTYRILPLKRLPRAPVAVGALAAAIAWEVSRRVFSFYLAHFARFTTVYGPLSGVIAFLLWIYVSAMIFLVGAEIARVLAGQDRSLDSGAAAPGRARVDEAP